VKVGALYVRDYPLRFAGDWTLTSSPSRVAKFYSDEVAAQVVVELKEAGLSPKILDAWKVSKTKS